MFWYFNICLHFNKDTFWCLVLPSSFKMEQNTEKCKQLPNTKISINPVTSVVYFINNL